MIEALHNIGFDWHVAVANLVNFVLIFWVLSRFVFRPLQEKIDERNRKIKQGVKDAELAEKELQSAQETYTQKTNEGKKQAREIIQSAHDEKKAIVAEARRGGEKEAKDIVRNAEREIERQERKMKEDFQREAVDLVFTATEKVVGQSFDKEKNAEFIRGIIKNTS